MRAMRKSAGCAAGRESWKKPKGLNEAERIS